MVPPISNSESTNFCNEYLFQLANWEKKCSLFQLFKQRKVRGKNSWNKLVKTSDEFVIRKVSKTDAMAMSLSSCENEMVRTGHSRYKKVSDASPFDEFYLLEICAGRRFARRTGTRFARFFFRETTMWTYRCHGDEFAIVREWDGTHGPFQIWESPDTGQFIDIPQRNQCVGTSHSKIFACGIKFDTNAICWVCL